uniref:Anticoagulant protein rhipilin-2 n=1 Tax=Rhipicephalus haemaphysaloides TaxID=237073 RepID=KUN2_RHIHE|nr:RecName: Full=Anticoagulant protein rhipilin-2; Flags: Precursor [Rhipicephalus haemaphysaloides]AFN22082.1 rhipilin-2 [Rhipicephalus haemaphysaloides]
MVLCCFALLITAVLVASKGAEEKPTCDPDHENKKVLWTCWTDDYNTTCFERSFYYNRQTDRCEEFLYEGCGGNDNNFPSIEDCLSNCKTNMTDYEIKFFQRLNKTLSCTSTYEKGSISRYILNETSQECQRADVKNGDIHFPSFRKCVYDCKPNSTSNPYCNSIKENGTKPRAPWNCYRQDGYKALFCYKPKNSK